MVDIDWTKAPEGATQYVVGSIRPWERIFDGQLSYFNGADWYQLRMREGSEEMQIIERPQPTHAWNGTGLPPVGTVCEYKRNDVAYRQEWVKVTLKYAGVEVTVLELFSNGSEYVEPSPSCIFRPTRTPEQIAADEREAAIEVIRLDLNLDEDHGYIARRVHSAGYLKPIKGGK